MLPKRVCIWSAALAVAGSLVTVRPAQAWFSVLADGSDGGPAVIQLKSDIRKGDAQALENALSFVDRDAVAKVKGVPMIRLELDSPGGDVVEALAIGQVLYQNRIMTSVRPGRECVSACVFVLAAGAVRYPSDGAAIGIHRPLLVGWRNISAAEAHARFQGLLAYLREYFAALGIADQTYGMMMRTAPQDMRYLSAREFESLGLRGEHPAWKALYARPAPPAGEIARPSGTVALAPPPALPKIDDRYRELVVETPAADGPADPPLPPRAKPYRWSLLDDGEHARWSPGRVDILVWLNGLATQLAVALGPLWWFPMLLVFEVLRARPWPGGAWRQRDQRDGWRLGGLGENSDGHRSV